MKPQEQRRTQSTTGLSSSGLFKLIQWSVGIVVVLLVLQSVLGSLSNLLPFRGRTSEDTVGESNQKEI